MRTVDPEVWSKKLKKSGIQTSRCNKFGQQPGLRYETIFRESLVDAATEFWTNCSVPVVRCVNMEVDSKCRRTMYILFLLVSVCLGIAVVLYNCHMFYVTPPLVISGLSSEEYIMNVNFPAVALCSNNIISRRALDNYTEFLFNHPMNKKKEPPYERKYIRDNLLQLGALLMWAQPPVQLQFDTFLLDVEPHFNITDIMFRFSPSCDEILERCSWRGRLVPCNRLFASRVTPLGFCCVSNSRYYPVDAKNKAHILDMTGQNFGLGVVITENKDDFVYVRRNMYGAEMLIFEGSEYPLLESGDVRMYPIPRNQALYVTIRIITQHASDDVKYFSEEWRGCRTSGAGQSRCLWSCRRDAAAALCGCVPYTLHAAARADTRRLCALRDLRCLNKHREKFIYQYPSTAGLKAPGVAEELSDGLECARCRVLCRRQLYVAHISYSKYVGKTSIYRNYLTDGLPLVNSSSIRIFYSKEKHERYSLEAYARWYEVLVILSTQWTAVAGVSAVVIAELVYFGTFRCVHHFLRRKRLAHLKTPNA